MTSSMKHSRTFGRRTLVRWISAGLLLIAPCVPAAAEWHQWGGPNGDFTLEGRDLAESWPADGPPRIWERPFGPGYATIVASGDRLYTMYRVPADQIEGRKDGDGREVVVALDAGSGATVWEHAVDAPVNPSDPSHDLRSGRGPNSTPLLVGDRLYTFGFTGWLHCLSAETGEELWSHDLRRSFGVNMPYFGHASSPIRFGDTVVVLAGGAMAFELDTGKLRWNNTDVKASYASPHRIRAGGKEQILAAVTGEIAGLDPETGAVLWRHPHANQYKTNLSSPLASGDLVFISAAWVGGRGLRIGPDNNVEEVWHNQKMQVAHSNAVRVGDWIYASSGVEVDLLTAIHAETGEIAWKDRSISHANLLAVGDRFVILDEDGMLSLASLTPEKLTIHQQVQLLDSRSWSAPTLADTRLYVRNEKQILALELGNAQSTEEALGRLR